MKAVAQGGASAAGPLREAALSEGAMLHHLLVACTTQVCSSVGLVCSQIPVSAMLPEV